MVKPDKDKIRERLRVLRDHRWPSYRAYGNYGAVPEWLVTGEVLALAGGREGYRRFVQAYVTRGMFRALSERVAIGSREFLDRARSRVKSVSAEQPERSFVASRIPFDEVVALVEQVKGEVFEDFHNRHGDWGLSIYSGPRLSKLKKGM